MRSYPNAAQGLRALMARSHLTAHAVCSRTGLAPQTLSGLLSGRQTTISTRTLAQLAQLFGMPMAMLIDYLSIPPQ